MDIWANMARRGKFVTKNDTFKPGIRVLSPPGEIRHQKRHIFGENQILKRDSEQNGGSGASPTLTASRILQKNTKFPLPSPKASFDLTKFATPDLNRASQTRGLGLKTWSMPKESHKFQGLSIKFPTPDSDRASRAQGLWILC